MPLLSSHSFDWLGRTPECDPVGTPTWAAAVRLAIVAALVLPVEVMAQARAAPAAPPGGAYTRDMSLPSAEHDMMEVVTRVAPRIHVFRAPLGFGPAPLANEALIEQRDGLVLVDAGKTRGAGKRIVALIRSVSTKPVKAVIITHWHQDHVLGLGPIVEAWPSVRIITSDSTRSALLTDGSYKGTPRTLGATAEHDRSRAIALAKYADEYGPRLRDSTLSPEERRGWADVVGVLKQRIADEQGTYLVLPTVTFTDRYAIDDPVAPVEALALGGAHTAGDIVVWMPKQRVVAAGDVIVAPIPYPGTRVLEWPSTLTRLKALHPQVIVPGHGPVETDQRYVDRMITALTKMRAKVAPLVPSAALTDDQVLSKIDLSVERKAFAGRDRWLGYWFDQYFAPNAAEGYTELRAHGAH